MSPQENETLRNMLKDKEDNAEVIAQMDQFESKKLSQSSNEWDKVAIKGGGLPKYKLEQ